MPPLKYREERRVCTDKLLKRLRKEGFDTNGYDRSMEKILTDKRFGLPILEPEGEYFGFTINHKYQRYYLNRADALAEEILLLRKLGMI